MEVRSQTDGSPIHIDLYCVGLLAPRVGDGLVSRVTGSEVHNAKRSCNGGTVWGRMQGE